MAFLSAVEALNIKSSLCAEKGELRKRPIKEKKQKKKKKKS
jgi:hypothetical protein